MRIPDHTIDDIRQATDIVDLVGGFVRLKKRGKSHLGLCPFHKEKTPSFTVSAERQMYHCFGCGAGGNVFTFLMQMEKISFVEAVRSLAKTAGIALPEPGAGGDPGVPTEQDRAYALLTLAARHFHANLTGTQEGKAALEYLRSRGIDDAAITRFGLGYALHSWDAFLSHAKTHGFEPSFVERYGLARRREDGSHYDYFRGRTIFPVFTASGRVAGFGARKLREDDPLAKYINSPESPLYAKSRILYGLSWSKEAIRGEDAAILVEGYMDLIALHQAGVANVVASSGTALTADQIGLLRRYTRNVTIVYDADSAGSVAALRGVDLILEQDLDVKVVRLPEGDDPDSHVRREGAAGFRKLLEGAHSFIDFIIASRKEKDGSPEERSKTIRILVRTIARMPDALKRDLYVKHVGSLYGIREAVLQAELASALREGSQGGQRFERRTPEPAAPVLPGEETSARPGEGDPIPAEERDLLTAVLRGGEEVARFALGHAAPADFSHPVTRSVAGLILERLEEGGGLEPAALVDAAGGAAARGLISAAMVEMAELERDPRPGESPAEPGDPRRIASDAIIAMKRRTIRAQKKENQERLRLTTASGGDALPFLRKNTLLDEELARLEREGLGS